MSQNEDQTSVYRWIDESFPNANLRRRLTHLFEEVTELAASANTELTLDKVLDVVRHSWEKAQGAPQNPQGEIADVRIALIGIASSLHVDEQTALNETMQKNRARSLQDRQAREATKQGLAFFKS